MQATGEIDTRDADAYVSRSDHDVERFPDAAIKLELGELGRGTRDVEVFMSVDEAKRLRDELMGAIMRVRADVELAEATPS